MLGLGGRSKKNKKQSRKPYQLIHVVVCRELLNERRESEVIHGPVVAHEDRVNGGLFMFGRAYLN